MTDIPIKETIRDKNSWFNIKRFSSGGIDFENIEKSLDFKQIRKTDFESFTDNTFRIFESSKTIRKFDQIQKLSSAEDNEEISDFFSKKSWLIGRTLLNFTFNFNPFNFITKFDQLGPFFKYYWEYSNLFLFVPNIKKSRTSFVTKEKEDIISIEDYIRFIDESHHMLNSRNSKPIFVPISPKMSFNDLEKLANHYLKKEYFYYWFDFDGQSINENASARIKYFLDIIDTKGYFDKIICYGTNVKREIISKPKDPNSPASDSLVSLIGANIVGVDREPVRPFLPNGTPTKKLIEHKARIFNSQTYYYNKTDNHALQNKGQNTIYNSTKLSKEFISQGDYLLKNGNLSPYLESKEMLRKYKGGDILKALQSREKGKQKSIDMWY